MNWLTRLFRPRPTLIGERMHAWYWSQWGRCEVEGEVVDEDHCSLYLDPSDSTTQEWRAWKRVWKHDARLVGEPLPVDVSPID